VVAVAEGEEVADWLTDADSESAVDEAEPEIDSDKEPPVLEGEAEGEAVVEAEPEMEAVGSLAVAV